MLFDDRYEHTSFRPMFSFTGQAEPSGNAQRFATEAEAEQSAAARFQVWTMPIGWTVEATDDPINYRFDPEKGDVSL